MQELSFEYRPFTKSASQAFLDEHQEIADKLANSECIDALVNGKLGSTPRLDFCQLQIHLLLSPDYFRKVSRPPYQITS
jgi:hypothetical protein